MVETMRGLQQRVQDPPLQLRGEAVASGPSCRAGPGAGLAPGLSGAAGSSAGVGASSPATSVPPTPHALPPADAVLLNNIVQNFGMLDLVKKVLASHKCQMDRSREQYARDLAGAWGVPASLVWGRSACSTGGHSVLSAGHSMTFRPLLWGGGGQWLVWASVPHCIGTRAGAAEMWGDRP